MIDYKAMIPPTVKPTGDIGVMLVQSRTDKWTWHRVDCELLECNCDSAQKGKARQAQKREGKRWSNRCPHIGIALATFGLLCLGAKKKTTKQYQGP